MTGPVVLFCIPSAAVLLEMLEQTLPDRAEDDDDDDDDFDDVQQPRARRVVEPMDTEAVDIEECNEVSVIMEVFFLLSLSGFCLSSVSSGARRYVLCCEGEEDGGCGGSQERRAGLEEVPTN